MKNILWLAAVLIPIPASARDEPRRDADKPHGIAARVPWTTSRITGSPEPPLPYIIDRAFPKLTFRLPLLMVTPPGSNRWFVGEQYGKLFSFPKDPNCDKADLVIDLPKELGSWDKTKVKGVGALYALAFHPRFEKNRYCYICYVLDSKKNGEQLPDGSRVSRFTVADTDPPRIDPASEKVLITWLAGGHNGCDMHFGPDGYLYISTGDAADPNPPDRLDTGQDLSDLLSSILRIDVDKEDGGKAYAVPPDNPFLKTPNARPEIWAYGFRNPWRMSFDRGTGNLWVGDVGWELWEMVYHVQRGGNYGWSVMEGPQVVRPEARRGPTPILPPAFAFPHTEGASVTGGYVYRGKRFPDLVGAYFCGDWVTRRVWATRFGEGDKVDWHKLIAQGTQRVVAFAQDHDGELFIVNHDDVGTLHQLAPNPAVKEQRADFPRKLSETGLFASTRNHVPAPGVVPFSINAEQWADHAIAERFLALPGESSVEMYDSPIPIPGGFYSGAVYLPKDGVLARTVSIEMERGQPQSRRRLETQILHFDGTLWNGYTYRWNDEQTDAVLVPAAGDNQTLMIKDAQAPGGKRQQTWHFPSRAECMTCHNPWAGHALAFTLPQLSKDHAYGNVVDNQLRALEYAGLITRKHNEADRTVRFKPVPHLTNPHDQSADLTERARSYLQVNCAHCHMFGAGGTADIELRHGISLEQTKTVEVRPVQGTFEIHGAHILSPGDPYRSVLFYRMTKLGRGRMPHIGSEIIDEPGTRLIRDWIRQLPVRKEDRLLLERLRELDESAYEAQERAIAAAVIDETVRRLARGQGRDAPSDADRQEAANQYKKQAADRARRRDADRTDAVGRLLSSTTGALVLAQAIDDRQLPDSLRPQVLASAMARSESQVRDLFERFIPDDQRVKRLGSVIKPEQILALKGNAERGKDLFFKSAGLQCVNCHRIDGTGSTLGPDLSQIGKQYTRVQILESILEPSKKIDPKYVTYLCETTDGKVHTGLLAEKTEQEVVLKIIGDKEVRIPARKVATLVPQQQSLMPELLLRDLTAEQAADLLEFLAGRK